MACRYGTIHYQVFKLRNNFGYLVFLSIPDNCRYNKERNNS